jgi:hypothetical protein
VLEAVQLLRDRRHLEAGDQVVVISDILAHDKLVNAVQMRQIL